MSTPVVVALIGLAGVLLGALVAGLPERAEDVRREQRAQHEQAAVKAHEGELDELRRVHRQHLHLMPKRLEAYAAVLAAADEAEMTRDAVSPEGAGEPETLPAPSRDPVQTEAALRTAVQVALLLAATSQVRAALVELEDSCRANLAVGAQERRETVAELRSAASRLRDAVRAEIGLQPLTPVAG